jgi:ADP-ribose pyrophosphatase
MPDEELYNDGNWRLTRVTASLPDGRSKTIVQADHFPTCHILALPTPKTVLLLREYRAFDGTWVWMLPSGKIDKEKDPHIAAERELREETGFRAGKMSHFCTMRISETYIPESHFFIATDLVKDPLPQDDDEMIEVHELPLLEALKRAQDTPQPRLASAFGLLRYINEHPEVR